MSAHLKALAKRTNPKTLPLFPVGGTVLLPGCDLPLNVFEPRYLNMVDDALKADRLIGMVQPNVQGEPDKGLNQIGGLGRIMQFAESDDGRYMMVLKGLKRFKILSILKGDTPYERANICFEEFENDIDVHIGDSSPEAFSTHKSERSALTMAMKSYAQTLGVRLDWNALKEIPLARLVDQAAMISPFGPEDKQSLLEAKTHADRRRLLIGLMHLHSDTGLYADTDIEDNNGPVLQ
ncbi:MAG: LON peptidase substrate-binding domain-containing protein [Robiginitomaculum sp.]|nr:LON peptidase substrate-binding domain-containing protein [Robiginitomaculum sp.]